MHRIHRIPAPSKEEIAALEAFTLLGLADIALISTAVQATAALHALQDCPVLGFDTESKPTFVKEQISEGPHIVQFATRSKAYVFQLTDPVCRDVVCALLMSSHIIKAGFGLAGDHTQIVRTLGITPVNVLDLNTLFRAQGYPKELGVRGAVAVLFKQRLMKSKKAATSNWANTHLTESQIIYSANDAWAAIRVYEALKLDAGGDLRRPSLAVSSI